MEFQVSCTANQSFDIDDPTTVAIGVHMMKPASGKNTITGCSGSITAQIPLYVDGETELKNSNLTLTTDNYYAINLNNNLTISGGTVNLKSTGSGAYGFYLKNASKLVFADSTNVTLAVDSVGIMVETAAASVAINSGTVNMSPKAGAAKPIGIYNCGTVTVSGGSLITTGIYSAIQNLGTVSFSGGTHTLNTSDSGVCYIDDASDDTLSISGNANVTLSGGAMNKLNGTLNVSGGALTISGTKTYGILLNGILNVTGGTMNVRDTQNYGIVVQGTLKQSGGTLTVSNAKTYGIYMDGTLNLTGGTMNIRDIQKSGSNSPACIAVLKNLELTGGTLNTSGTTIGMIVSGVATSFSGTNANIGGTAAGWYGVSGASYSVTGGTVVFQGGGNGAANAIYSSLGEDYKVYAGTGEGYAPYEPSPTEETFTKNTYVLIKAVRSYTLTLVNVRGASSATHLEGESLSYTAADAPDKQHFDHWELKVGSGAATNVGTNTTYTGTMPSGNATLTAVYAHCSGGTATCKDKAVCDYCGKPYGEVNKSNHTGGTEIRNSKAATCTEDGYTGDTCCKGCNTRLATGTVIPAGHTDTNKDHICDAETCKATISSCSGGTATCKDKAICDYCGKPYGNVDGSNHTGETEIREVREATCTEDGYTGDTYCKGCEAKLSDGSAVAKTGHAYESKVTKEPTTTSTGTRTYTCKNCGHSYEEEIARLPEESEVPKTGDGSQMMLWLALLLLSSTALAAAVACGRKKRFTAR